jgi:hypothetical protein
MAKPTVSRPIVFVGASSFLADLFDDRASAVSAGVIVVALPARAWDHEQLEVNYSLTAHLEQKELRRTPARATQRSSAVSFLSLAMDVRGIDRASSVTQVLPGRQDAVAHVRRPT